MLDIPANAVKQTGRNGVELAENIVAVSIRLASRRRCLNTVVD